MFTSLAILDLSHNTLINLSNQCISNTLPNLLNLNLSHNRLSELNFVLPESLLKFNSSNNSLNSVSKEVFKKCINITEIDLSCNELTSIVSVKACLFIFYRIFP